MSLNNAEKSVSGDVNVCEERQDEEFTEPTEFSDIILNVQGKQLHAVRCILITASPVFRAMLTSTHFKESKADEIDFPTDSFGNMQLLLKHINPDAGVLTAYVSEKLLPLADKYQMEGLKKRCINCLCSNLKEIPNSRLVSLLTVTEQLGIDKLTEECVKLLTKMSTKELTEHIDNASPKSTVTWQIVRRLLQPFFEEISKHKQLIDFVRELSTRHPCDYDFCLDDANDEAHGQAKNYDIFACWNNDCIKRFANDVITRFIVEVPENFERI